MCYGSAPSIKCGEIPVEGFRNITPSLWKREGGRVPASVGLALSMYFALRSFLKKLSRRNSPHPLFFKEGA